MTCQCLFSRKTWGDTASTLSSLLAGEKWGSISEHGSLRWATVFLPPIPNRKLSPRSNPTEIVLAQLYPNLIPSSFASAILNWKLQDLIKPNAQSNSIKRGKRIVQGGGEIFPQDVWPLVANSPDIVLIIYLHFALPLKRTLLPLVSSTYVCTCSLVCFSLL